MKVNEVKAKLVEVGTTGVLVDANNPSVRRPFSSEKEIIQARAVDLINKITRLVKLANAGQDYSSDAFKKAHPNTYFPSYQAFIDAGTTEFLVELTTTFKVQK